VEAQAGVANVTVVVADHLSAVVVVVMVVTGIVAAAMELLVTAVREGSTVPLVATQLMRG
jgi:hypothetical protein